MKNTLEEILNEYVKQDEVKNPTTEELSTASYELWEYLCGDGDVRHLYNYYEIVGWNQEN